MKIEILVAYLTCTCTRCGDKAIVCLCFFGVADALSPVMLALQGYDTRHKLHFKTLGNTNFNLCT